MVWNTFTGLCYKESTRMGKESRLALLCTGKGSAVQIAFLGYLTLDIFPAHLQQGLALPGAWEDLVATIGHKWLDEELLSDQLHWLLQAQQHLNRNCCGAAFLWKGGCDTNRARGAREGTAAGMCFQLETGMLSSPAAAGTSAADCQSLEFLRFFSEGSFCLMS